MTTEQLPAVITDTDIIDHLANNGMDINDMLNQLGITMSEFVKRQRNQEFKTELEELHEINRRMDIFQAQTDRRTLLTDLMKDKANLKPAEQMFLAQQIGRIANEDRSLKLKMEQEVNITVTQKHESINLLERIPLEVLESAVQDAEYEEVEQIENKVSENAE